jgi:hypothetical protein
MRRKNRTSKSDAEFEAQVVTLIANHAEIEAHVVTLIANHAAAKHTL